MYQLKKKIEDIFLKLLLKKDFVLREPLFPNN